MMATMKLCLVALACATTVSAWDLDGDNGWIHADTNGVQLTQVQQLICEGAHDGQTQTPIEGCNTHQDTSATRTWSGYWDYITVGGGYPQGPPRYPQGEGYVTEVWGWVGSLTIGFHIFWAAMILGYSLVKAAQPQPMGAGGSAVVAADDENLKLTGYQETYAGNLCYVLYHLYTPVFAICYTVLIIDTYYKCELKGPDNLCFRGANPIFGNGKHPQPQPGDDIPNPSINQNIFFAFWCFGVSWAMWNYMFGHKMANWFRSYSTFETATHIHCSYKSKTVVMSNPSAWVRVARLVTRFFFGSEVKDIYFEGTPRVTVQGLIKKVEFMCTQFTFSEETKNYERARFDVEDQFPALRASTGLTGKEFLSRQLAVGNNEIPYRTNTLVELIAAEFCSYLYMYQFTFFLVWLWFGGIIWCSPQVIVVVVTAGLSVTITRKNQQKIKEIGTAGTGVEVEVCRDGKWIKVISENLVPGDLVKLTDSCVIACDMIVVKGTCICDESGLTGESMPVRKSEVPTTPGTYNVKKDEKSTLFAGTTLLQADSAGSLAVVSQTGIRTAKGDLVSAILYPSTMVFEYDEQLRVVFTLLAVYATILFVISIWLQLKISKMSWVSVFAFACFTISQILPPLLPVALVIGHTKSANRLKKKKVLCVQPKRIAISGKIHAVMFDKTGTLTKQGLDFIGVHRANAGAFSPAVAAGGNVTSIPASALEWTGAQGAADLMSWALATCHAVTTLRSSGGATPELVGNQVEVKMFGASKWRLDDSTAQVTVTDPATGQKLSIVKRFEFDHHTMTMSVVVRDQSGECHIFCKGAPEKVGDLCTPASKPADFSSISSQHALQGCYVIGMSTRKLGKMTDLEISQLTRSSVEKDLAFQGNLLFRNELKEDTTQAIKKIIEGDVRPVMVTGDNAHCGHYIARQCGILAPNTRIFLTSVEGGSVSWSDMNPDAPAEVFSTGQVLDLCKNGDNEMAITGKAMKILTDQKVIDDLLIYTRIFARVQPDQKVQVITLYIDQGYITAMCGDGGNDCGALRAAHAGIALSDAEASVVSPFTSSTKSVQSVVDVLCEGRCSLVTSFAAYRFYIMYGLNWSIVKTINFVYGVRMPITSYLTIDSICSWLCAWAITGALPLDKLHPFRPTSSLFDNQIILSCLVPWAIYMITMGILLTWEQELDDHVDFPPQIGKGVGYWELGDSWESTIFTYFQVCPLIWSGVAYSIGNNFRKPVYTNIPMLAVWGTIFLLYTIILLAEPGDFSAFFHCASNAFNGFNTNSPIWMRYQFPKKCPTSFADAAWADGNMTAWEQYNIDTGLGPFGNGTSGVGMDGVMHSAWRAGLPDNCAAISKTVNICGANCAQHIPGMPTNGMEIEYRFIIWITVVLGMTFVMGWELFLNKTYIVEANWHADATAEHQAQGKTAKELYVIANPKSEDDGYLNVAATAETPTHKMTSI